MPERKLVDLGTLMQEFAQAVKDEVARPNIYAYKPYPKQEAAHRDDFFQKMVLGGNRAGKTAWNAAEMVMWLTGQHKYRETPPPPVMGRCIVVDVVKGIDKIMLPAVKQMVPRDFLIGGSWEKSWDPRTKTLTLTNGSQLDFLTYEMDLDKHGGVSRHFVSFDEEPPQHIFNEAQQRLIEYDGSWWASMTPLQGFTWMYEMLYQPALDDPKWKEKQSLGVYEFAQTDNPHLKAQDRTRFYVGASDEERESREYGKFVSASGLIFPDFTTNTHVVEAFIPPKDWEWYMSMDEGWNNPTAVLWHAVSPTGIIVTFSEHYARQMTLQEHAALIHTREAAFGRVPDLRTGDPAMKQTSTQTGVSKLQMLSEYGIDLSVDRVPHDVETGIIKMQQYLKVSKITNQPHWFVTNNCENFIREMKGLRYASYTSRKAQFDLNKQEKVHKKNDHTFDAARYFATFLPDLAPEEVDRKIVLPVNGPNGESYDTILARQVNDPSIQIKWDDEPAYEDYY